MTSSSPAETSLSPRPPSIRREGDTPRHWRSTMSRVIVNQFITLDGIVEDPDGSGGTKGGGWAWRDGGEAVQSEKARLSEVMQTTTLLLGRSTWPLFSRIFPGLSDDFSIQMNRMPKLVVS